MAPQHKKISKEISITFLRVQILSDRQYWIAEKLID
jgi:hypothetical protein